MASAGLQSFVRPASPRSDSLATFAPLVCTPDQPNVEIALLNPLGEGMHYDDEAKAAFKVLLEKGALGAGVLYTPDCHATYEEPKAKDVHFKSEPKEQFYGIEAIITDGVGNWFSMSQPK